MVRRPCRCVYACKPPYDHRGPCPQCAADHEELMDESYALHVLGKAHLAQIRSEATDAEFAAWWDGVAPVEMPSVSFSFRSKPFIEDSPRFETP